MLLVTWFGRLDASSHQVSATGCFWSPGVGDRSISLSHCNDSFERDASLNNPLIHRLLLLKARHFRRLAPHDRYVYQFVYISRCLSVSICKGVFLSHYACMSTFSPISRFIYLSVFHFISVFQFMWLHLFL